MCQCYSSPPSLSRSGEGAPAFEHYIETINDKRDVWKVGYVKAHKRLYELVKKYQHKDEVQKPYGRVTASICVK